MVQAATKPEYVVYTIPTDATCEEILVTNKGNTWIKGYDDGTGAKNATLVGGKFIINR